MAFDMAFDFRGTLAYVTDPAYGAFATSSHTYPHTYTNGNGYSINGGFTLGPEGAQDGSTSVDPRLAGSVYEDSAVTFQIDLGSGSAPGAGNYVVDMAMGHADADRQASDVFVKDNTTAVIGPSGTLGTLAGQFIDATLALRSPGTSSWDLVATTVPVTFATTTVVVGYTGVGFGSLAHFRLTLVPPAGTNTNITPRRA